MKALSGRVVLGARRVWGKLGNLLGLLSPAPSDVSEFWARGEPEASRHSLTCCHRAGEAVDCAHYECSQSPNLSTDKS